MRYAKARLYHLTAGLMAMLVSGLVSAQGFGSPQYCGQLAEIGANAHRTKSDGYSLSTVLSKTGQQLSHDAQKKAAAQGVIIAVYADNSIRSPEQASSNIYDSCMGRSAGVSSSTRRSTKIEPKKIPRQIEDESHDAKVVVATPIRSTLAVSEDFNPSQNSLEPNRMHHDASEILAVFGSIKTRLQKDQFETVAEHQKRIVATPDILEPLSSLRLYAIPIETRKSYDAESEIQTVTLLVEKDRDNKSYVTYGNDQRIYISRSFLEKAEHIKRSSTTYVTSRESIPREVARKIIPKAKAFIVFRLSPPFFDGSTRQGSIYAAPKELWFFDADSGKVIFKREFTENVATIYDGSEISNACFQVGMLAESARENLDRGANELSMRKGLDDHLKTLDKNQQLLLVFAYEAGRLSVSKTQAHLSASGRCEANVIRLREASLKGEVLGQLPY